MHSDFERIYKEKKDPFGNNPALVNPDTGKSMTLDLARQEFVDLELRIRRLQEGSQLLHPMELIRRVTEAESDPRIRIRLAEIACKLVSEEFGFGPDDLLLDAKIIDFHQMPTAPRAKPANQDESSSLEVHKRKIVNALIHGGAHLGQNLFHLEMEKLADINPVMPGLYRQVMEVGDAANWHIAPKDQQQMSKEMPMTGCVKLDFSTRPIKVVARAVNFPILLHELTKGVLEALCLHGLPADEKTRHAVLDASDKLEEEVYHLQVGPALWKSFLKAVCTGTDGSAVRSELLKEFVKLPAAEFLSAIADLVSGAGSERLEEIKARLLKRG